MTAAGSVYVEDVATQLVSYTSINVYRGSTSNPDTAAFTTLVTTLTLVSGTLSYAFTDSSGTVSTLWRCTYYNTSTLAESGLGPVIKPGSTMATFRADCARAARLGTVGSCSSDGTTLTLIDTALTMSGVDSYFHEGDWLYRPNAAASGDKLRRISEAGFAAATGTFSIPSAYPWTNLPASTTAYEIYSVLPPVETPAANYSWNDAIRDGLRDLWFNDQVNLGVGGTIGQTRYSLLAFGDMITRDSITAVMFRTTDSNGVLHDMLLGTRGTFWSVMENDGGNTLILSESPSTDETIIINIKRRFALPYIDSDVMAGPLSLALAATNRQLFWKLEGDRGPRYQEWQGRYRQEYRVYGARAAVLV